MEIRPTEEAGLVRTHQLQRRLDPLCSGGQLRSMSKQEIDGYLAKVDEPKRATLQKMRQTILDILPDAEEVIAYGMPAFRLTRRIIVGFAAFKHALAYQPHSRSVCN